MMTLFILWLALSLERLLRLVDIVASAGAPIGHVIELQLYLAPHYLGLAVPAAFFIGALLGFRRLFEDSELVVMRAAGISLRRIIKPVLFFSILLSVVMLIMNGFVKPHARYAYRAGLHEMSSYSVVSNIQPGVFQEVNKQLTVRTEGLSERGKTLESVFVASTNKNGAERTFATARKAVIRRDSESGVSDLLLIDGRLVREKNGEITGKLIFSEYPWKLHDSFHEPYGERGQDEREMIFLELLKGKVNQVDNEVSLAKSRAEFYARIIQSISMPALALLALPLSLLGSGRTGRAYGFVLGIIILVLYEKLLGLAEAYAASGVVPAFIAVPMPLIILTVFSYGFFAWMTPQRQRRRFRKKEAM